MVAKHSETGRPRRGGSLAVFIELKPPLAVSLATDFLVLGLPKAKNMHATERSRPKEKEPMWDLHGLHWYISGVL